MPNPVNSNDPRSYIRNVGVDWQYLAVAVDATINIPGIQQPGPGPAPSTSVGKAVTWVGAGTSTYGNDNDDNFIVGLGVAGNPVAGILVRVDPDGLGTLLYKGTGIEALANKTSPPLVGGLVAVDGTGQVQASTAAANANAKCMNFAPSLNQAIFTHPQGTITPPTTNQQTGSIEYCQISLSGS